MYYMHPSAISPVCPTGYGTSTHLSTIVGNIVDRESLVEPKAPGESLERGRKLLYTYMTTHTHR